MNILLIEPDTLLGKTYKAALERNGHKVMHHRHAQAAVLAAEKSKPDVIVLELQLPGHSGIEFLYEFRSYPEWQDVPVVLHTWVAEQTLQTQRSAFDRLRIVDYLYKPATNLKQLVRAVDELQLAVA